MTTGSKIPVRIELEAISSHTVERFENSLRKHPEIEECYAVSGRTDYLLYVSVKDLRGYEEVHREVLSRLPGVRKIRADIPLRRVVPF
ncbi:AsnC family transcriptional regulator [Mesorhizobium plurifarium]|uniref:AsnC family transcriptional regulator n=1 Tax=Mesorhizobium plurifarium TaxID=69974 RepID=A0A0K2VUG6_MESPL|nr:AsnC family transcriptional regulator [Mesorhizobium plurifarium]